MKELDPVGGGVCASGTPSGSASGDIYSFCEIETILFFVKPLGFEPRSVSPSAEHCNHTVKEASMSTMFGKFTIHD